MATDFKKFWLNFNKAGQEDIVQWITVHGAHIPIKGGQTKGEAISDKFGNEGVGGDSSSNGSSSVVPKDKTSKEHFIDPTTKTYTPERQELHDKIIKDTLSRAKKGGTPVVRFVTGHSASGKSKFYKDIIEENYPDLGELNVDNIKSVLGGNTPQYHEEGGDVMERLMQEAARTHTHFAYNGIVKDTPKYKDFLAILKEEGYTIDADVVQTDLSTALQRAKERSSRTGQIVPESEIKDNYQKFRGGVDLLKNYTEPNYYDGAKDFKEQFKRIRDGQ
jgi:predicted ABC-type ATPase